jgi:DNA invertase Pin-like site-specific DNA recombinase
MAVQNEAKSPSLLRMMIGYARVSTVHQNLDRQLKGRPELDRAIDALGKGDVLVLAEWDRATRSMFDGIAIMQRVHLRGAAIKVLDKPHLDLTTRIGQGFLAFLSALAEDERERIVRRASEGRTVARQKGVKLGRKPKLTGHQRIKARTDLANGKSCRAVAQDLNVHHSTVSRLR